ncbi:MAG: hypothetical protein NC079_06900 [Clostridium sp.]|nr:hypothetical protein [Acetatifactor muris]MCM1526883.1 hypothetical protein [Bacteroides sp.]MCM1563324.1 hypothetical protein [Clostridium sp.]
MKLWNGRRYKENGICRIRLRIMVFLAGGLAVSGLLAGCARAAEPDAADGTETTDAVDGTEMTDVVNGTEVPDAADGAEMSADAAEPSAGTGTEPQSVDEWYASLTEEDFRNAKTPDEIDYDEWGSPELILLGELPEQDVRIYGEVDEGELMIVECRGERRTFSHDFLTPRMIMPEFAAYDYDGDGAEEIGMICYVGAGTGFAVREFAVFDSVEDSFDTLHVLPYEQFFEMCDTVEYSYEGDVLRVAAGDTYEEHSLAGSRFEGMPVTGMSWGNQIDFRFGEQGEVFCYAKLMVALEDQATPFALEEMETLFAEGAVPWENTDFRFRVHYDGQGVFDTDEPELCRFLPGEE